MIPVPTAEEIMERLSRVCRHGTSVMCRTTLASGSSKWYVNMSGVDVNVHTTDMSGASPQEAIINTWNMIANRPSVRLVRYFCKSDESIPGRGPQVWVRWSQELDDWEDVEPDKDGFAAGASEIRSYADHKWREAMN